MVKQKIMGENLKFTSDPAIQFFLKILSDYKNLIKDRKRIIFVPCAATKPIQLSPTHCFLSPITRIHDDQTLILILSEPLTIIPYCCNEYPNYEYKPLNSVKDFEETNRFIDRLNEFKKLTPSYFMCYYIGGKHHFEILKKAKWNVKQFIPKRGIIDYNKYAKKMRNSIFSEEERKYLKKRKMTFRLKKIDKNVVKIEFSSIELYI